MFQGLLAPFLVVVALAGFPRFDLDDCRIRRYAGWLLRPVPRRTIPHSSGKTKYVNDFCVAHELGRRRCSVHYYTRRAIDFSPKLASNEERMEFIEPVLVTA